MPIQPRAPSSRRDHRLDVLRGIALVMIFINHVPGNTLEHLTSRNFGFSDAAEGFVLMSGIAAALAYSGAFDRMSFVEAAAKSWRRARKLYLTHILISLMALALLVIGAFWLGSTDTIRSINFMPLVRQPVEALMGLPTLGHQFGYFNILPLYMVLLLAMPAYVWIARRSIPLMLGIAVAIWLTAGLFRLNLPNFPNEGGWFFNPIAWQLLFAIGLAAGMAKKRGERLIPHDRRVAIAALLFLAASFLWVRLRLGGLPGHEVLPFFIGGFDKTFLALPRLLHILALAYVLVYFAPLAKLMAHRIFEPIALMGRNGLHVFAAGSVLAVLIQLICEYLATNTLQTALFVVAGLLVQYSIALHVSAKPANGIVGAPAPATSRR
jgi:hypothetical protein